MAGCNFTPTVLNITSLFLNYFEPHQAISTTSSRIRPSAAASGHQHHQQPHQAISTTSSRISTTSSRIRPPAAASGHQQPHQAINPGD
jgi:hypothetical protein